MNGTVSALEHFNQAYQLVHAPAVVVICLFGACSHALTISVLARRPLFSPTNAVLVSLSASQLCLCVNYLYITLYKYYADSRCVTALWAYPWMFAFLVNVNFSVVFHTSGVFHVIGLSVVRYISIYHLAKMKNTRVPWFNFAKASATIAAIYVIVTILCVPFYLNSEVVAVPRHPNDRCSFESEQLRIASNNATNIAYEIKFSLFGRINNLTKINFFLFGIGCKLVPCMVLLVMSFLLVFKLRELQAASANLLQYGSEVRGVRTYQRTTHLILVVMCLFVLVELPQGVVNLLAGVIGKKFERSVLQNLADFFEMLTVLYSSVNFAIFCLMSGQFRTAFIANLVQLCPKWLLTKACAVARSDLRRQENDLSSGSGGRGFCGGGGRGGAPTEQSRGESMYQSMTATKAAVVVLSSPDSGGGNNAASIAIAAANDGKEKEKRPLMNEDDTKFKSPAIGGVNGTSAKRMKQPTKALQSNNLMEITAV
uniref:G-protein coupled receptors family 1 profile domain-containing protein n=1 Tax=Plectus sambesii TaxID=2011161 RepID=A0A914VUJ1_9BILA